jgi:hypothetical protein
MTHKYDRVSKVIKELFGEPNQFMSDHYIKDHADLVHFAYAVLEEFEKDETERWTSCGNSRTSNIYGEETRGGRLF